jgi:hypothetical protein
MDTGALPGRSIGPNTDGLVDAGLANRPHLEQRVRTCPGMLCPFRGFDPARAEAVAARPLTIGAVTYKSVAAILENNLDRAPQALESTVVIGHPNVNSLPMRFSLLLRRRLDTERPSTACPRQRVQVNAHLSWSSSRR